MVATIDIFKGSDFQTSYYSVYYNMIFYGSVVERDGNVLRLGIVAKDGFEPTEDQKKMELVIHGKNITYDKDGNVTGGTVTSVEFINKLGTVAELTGYPMKAAELYNAFIEAQEFNLEPIFDILYNRVPYVVNGSEFGDYFGAASLGDTFYGNGGDDTLDGAKGDDRIFGGDDDDRLSGGEGKDTVRGEDGNDRIDGGLGNDQLDGGAGDDVVKFSAGRDRIAGGDGTDYLNVDDVSTGVPVTIDLAKKQIKIGSDVSTISSIEGVVGGQTSGGDRYLGNAADNVFAPQGFNQFVDGRDGFDRLIFYRHDEFFGFATRDTSVRIDAEKGIAGVYFEDEAVRFKNIESFAGSHSNDSFIGSDADEEFLPLQGYDTVDGGDGIDTLSFELDLVVPDSSVTKQGVVVDLSKNEVLDTAGGVDTISNIENVTGSIEADDVTGDKKANLLRGIEGADTLVGGLGNDTLEGGLGADSLEGGKGKDVFLFADKLGKANVDEIGDFSVRDDTFHLDRAVFTKMAKGVLDDDAFVVGTRAKDGEDRIIYDSKTGSLFFDVDGKGGAKAVEFAEIDAGLKLTEKDFVIV